MQGDQVLPRLALSSSNQTLWLHHKPHSCLGSLGLAHSPFPGLRSSHCPPMWPAVSRTQIASQSEPARVALGNTLGAAPGRTRLPSPASPPGWAVHRDPVLPQRCTSVSFSAFCDKGDKTKKTKKHLACSKGDQVIVLA